MDPLKVALVVTSTQPASRHDSASRTSFAATFQFGWTDIAGAMRIFGELVRETPDEVRAGFNVDAEAGASARGGFYGDSVAAAAYLAKWRAAFRPVEPRMESSVPNPQGEVWAATSLAVDGGFLEGLTGDVVDVLARAAVAARGVGAMLMGLSNGVASRIALADTAYPLRGTGLSCLLSAEWNGPRTAKGRCIGSPNTVLRCGRGRAVPM